ncbi:hypothetical protein [Anabaena sphaerica]|nr:hypothetical protein [Anabaena sphaerica]
MKHLLAMPTNFVTGDSHDYLSIQIHQFMEDKYTCLCCSDTLLRHVCSRGVYWRCSSCYQEMPV